MNEFHSGSVLFYRQYLFIIYILKETLVKSSNFSSCQLFANAVQSSIVSDTSFWAPFVFSVNSEKVKTSVDITVAAHINIVTYTTRASIDFHLGKLHEREMETGFLL